VVSFKVFPLNQTLDSLFNESTVGRKGGDMSHHLAVQLIVGHSFARFHDANNTYYTIQSLIIATK